MVMPVALPDDALAHAELAPVRKVHEAQEVHPGHAEVLKAVARVRVRCVAGDAREQAAP